MKKEDTQSPRFFNPDIENISDEIVIIKWSQKFINSCKLVKQNQLLQNMESLSSEDKRAQQILESSTKFEDS